jgi:hypothetical protein
MAALKVTAPVDRFTGDVAGIYFRDGTARVDDSDPSVRAALAYCRRRGYTVEPAGSPAEPESAEQKDLGPERPKDYAPKPEWVAYATKHPDPTRRLSDAAAQAMTKTELVELFSDNPTDEEGPLQ